MINQGVPGDNPGNLANNIGQTRLVAFDFAYDAQGLVASYCATHYSFDRQTHAGNDPNSVNTRGWLQKVRTMFYGKDSSGNWVSRVLSQNEYTYDTAGQRLTNTVSMQLLLGGVPKTNTDGSPYLTGRTEAYTYDKLNRLKTVSYGDGESQAYTFDPMGNRTEKDDTVGSGTASTSYAFDAANRLTATTGTGAATYASDADGNTLSDGRRTNTWDSQNRLVHCSAIDASDPNTTHDCSYTYGADGLRRSQTLQNEFIATPVNTNTTDYAYDGTMLVRKMKTVSGTLTPTATYLQGPSGPLYRRDDTQGEGTYTDGTRLSLRSGASSSQSSRNMLQ